MPDAKIIPLHRGAYPDFPHYVRPRPHTGAELSRMVGDPDAAFARDEEGDRVWNELRRFNREHPVDLGEWLNRGRSGFGAFVADLRDHSDLFIFGLTLGICIGALATVLLAFAWAGAL
jgi:hypothetical protein